MSTLRCTLLGQPGVGKTNMCTSAVTNDFSNEHIRTRRKETYGLRYHSDDDNPDEFEILEVEDTPALISNELDTMHKRYERQKHLTEKTPLISVSTDEEVLPVTCQLFEQVAKRHKAHGFIVVFDFGSLASFEDAKATIAVIAEWCKYDLNGTNDDIVPVMLVGAKDDLPRYQKKVDEQMVNEYLRSTNGVIDYYAVSARLSRNVHEVFQKMMHKLMEARKNVHEDSDYEEYDEGNKRGCCVIL